MGGAKKIMETETEDYRSLLFQDLFTPIFVDLKSKMMAKKAGNDV